MLPFWNLRHCNKEKDLNGNEWGHWAELKRAVEESQLLAMFILLNFFAKDVIPAPDF